MIVPMAEHPNLEIARRAWQAVSESDVDALAAIFADSIVWHATGRRTPWEGTHRGRDEMIDHLARVGESVEIFDARLDDVLVSSDRVAFIYHVSARRGDRSLEVDYQLLGRIENGMVVEVWTTPLDPLALETFWS